MNKVIILSFFTALPTAVYAQDVTPQKLIAYCETPPHYPTKGGENCWSNWHEITAPSGYVFAKEAAKGGVTSHISGEVAQCHLEWDKNADVLPGIPQPTYVRLRVYGEMNQGFGEGGHTKCEFELPMIKISP